jgi:hypothetical protein
MLKRLIIRLIAFLYRFTYEAVTLDKINQKMIRPVPGLVINGVQYFEFINAGDMPQARLVHFNYLREEISMGIDRVSMNEYLDQLEAANKEQNVNRIGSLLFMLRDTVNNITTVESLYNLATLWYFDPKEDIATYDYDYNERKKALFKSFHDKGFFFGRLLQHALKHTGLSLPADIQRFLNENAVKASAYRQILSGRTESKP